MIKYFIYIFLYSFVLIVITGSFSYGIINILLYLTGIILIKLFTKKKLSFKLFSLSFLVYSTYILMQYLYMENRNFDYLQSFDGFEVYLPYTLELINQDLTFLELVQEIYTTSKFAFVGSILIPFVYIGKISVNFNESVYFALLQITVFFAAISIPVIYNILSIFNFTRKQLYSYTLLFAFCSIHFYMSGFLVRDMPITLGYYLIIYLVLTPFKLRTVLYILLISSLIMTVRLSSGIFALLFLIIYLYSTFRYDKKRNKVLSGFLFLISIFLVLSASSEIIQLTSEKQNVYLDIQANADQGSSTVAAFNSLPFGMSHFVKAVYNQLMPLPSWRNMIETNYRPESYNIMNFLIVPATFFQFSVFALIIFGFTYKKLTLFKSMRIFKYLFIAAVLFLLSQSSTLGHRRMMGVYPIFYVVSIISFLGFSERNKKQIIFIIISVFLILQILGFIYIK